ncbi:RmlC-like cupin domain-containing protein [Schizophyllum fasciatum]
MNSNVKITPRPSQERGNADHDWLKTFHTFSFASYHDGLHQGHGPLRVMNEDRVAPGTGFGTHGHQEFEIFSYIVNGQLAHQDSMGNTEVLSRGAVQLTSAGTGILHSEKAHGPQEVHFLQIWSFPSTRRLKPKYYTRNFTDEEKTDRWARVVAPVGSKGVSEEREAEGPAPVHSPLMMYATLLGKGKAVSQAMSGSKGYIHVVQTSGYNVDKATGGTIRMKAGQEELQLREGDGAYLSFPPGGVELTVDNTGIRTAEIVLFDLQE